MNPKAHPIRGTAVAGSFYPDSPDRLREDLREYLDATGEASAREALRCIVVPHAGYVYSAPTAAHAYACVAGRTVRRVVLLGCSHRHRFDGASVVTEGSFDTPLGPLLIDAAYAKALTETLGSADTAPHESEHSLEVQLPFIREVLGEAPIVPVLFGSEFGEGHRKFARYLADTLDERDLVVCSTDLSHYLTERAANELDKQSLDTLMRQDVNEVVEAARDGRLSMCGVTAVATAMEFCLAAGIRSWEVLDYRTSAAASGDRERVVGYAAVAMETEACA